MIDAQMRTGYIETYLASKSMYMDLSYITRHLSVHRVVYKPNKELGIECYGNAGIAGVWSQEDSDNADNFMLRTGYIFMYAGCALLWRIKLQMEIYLSTMESE